MRPGLLALAILMAAPALASVSDGVRKWRAGDYEGAVADWTGPAANGDAEALFNMGQAYLLGRGVPRDRDTAIGYYRRASAKGHVAATANLGIALFQSGRRTEALGPLREAADRGDARAAYVLGTATFSGEGSPRNPVLGYAYMVRARDAGLAEAERQTARMATLLTELERQRGEAAAAALAAGRPIPVELLGPGVRPAPVAVAAASEPEDGGEPEAPPVRARGQRQPVRAAGAEKTVEAAPAAAPGWRVQLGAYADEPAARRAWATLVSQSARLLEGLQPIYAPSGRLVRLQVGPFEGRQEAGDLCRRLAEAGRPCFVADGGRGQGNR
jgi:cell division septation protein DedD